MKTINVLSIGNSFSQDAQRYLHELAKSEGVNIHRDTFHASLGLGRFILALVWYKYMTGNSIDNVSFNNFDEPVSEEEYKIAIDSVNKVFNQ